MDARVRTGEPSARFTGPAWQANRHAKGVALDYFCRLGHDNHRRLSKLYLWEEKKSKASWGAQTVDYEKIAAAAVQAMKAADLHRFLVVCALVSDLYWPGYNPRQSLARDSNLARIAMRYKIDSPKVTAAVRAELLSKNRSNTSQQSPKQIRRQE